MEGAVQKNILGLKALRHLREAASYYFPFKVGTKISRAVFFPNSFCLPLIVTSPPPRELIHNFR